MNHGITVEFELLMTSISYKACLRTEEHEYYCILEIEPWLSNPGTKTETWNYSDDTPVIENDLNIEYGFTKIKR